MKKKPLILITNDDGVNAAGLKVACGAVKNLGDVWVIAPKEEYSSCGHAVTLMKPVFCRKLGEKRYSIEGTPADCVFIACSDILPALPDIVLSGINYGPNVGKDTFYSGTVAAAREAAFRGIPSAAISLERNGRLEKTEKIVEMIARSMLKSAARSSRKTNGATLLLNVNIPSGKPRGLRLTRLGLRVYRDHVIRRASPRKQVYYWLNGGPAGINPGRGSDGEALSKGYISVTPLRLDQNGTDAVYKKANKFIKELDTQWSPQY